MYISNLIFLLTLLLTEVSCLYTEKLDITPVSRTEVLSSFQFSITQPHSNAKLKEYTLFPRSLGQTLDQSHCSELHLKFGHGFWDILNWGSPPQNGEAAGGIGVELWAWIEAHTEGEAVLRWNRLVNLLGGYFCASLNFINENEVTFPPPKILKPKSNFTSQHFLMRGALPAEPVCTENLTPFLKLLPCQSNAGIASLLNGHHLFNSKWQNMNVDFYKPSIDEVRLDLTVANVMDSTRNREDPLPWPIKHEDLQCDSTKSLDFACLPLVPSNWEYSLSSLFGKKIVSVCPVALNSELEVHAPQNWLVSNSTSNRKFDLTKIDVTDEEFDLHLKSENAKEVSVPLNPHVYVDRSFSGYGQQRGGIRITLSNNHMEPIKVDYLETLPWFMKLYLHTLQLNGNGKLTDVQYTPSQQRKRPNLILFTLEIEPKESVTFEYLFDKSMLFIEEYPPDANHGFEISPGFAVCTVNNEKYEARTTSLLLPLPVPDFSMPYNVIILSATSMGLAFGSVFNLLIRKPVDKSLAPELNKRQQKPIQKLLGMVLSLLGK